MSARDSQRAAVYGAEKFVRTMFDRAAEHSSRSIDFFGTTLTLPPEARFASVPDVAGYTDRVLAMPAVRQRWDPAPLRVRERRGATAAHYEISDGPAAIAVPDRAARWALRELVVFFGHFTAVYSTIPVQRPESHDGGCRNRAFGCP